MRARRRVAPLTRGPLVTGRAAPPIEAIFKAVGGLRTELSFDREGDTGAKVPKKEQLRSLHVKASVDLG